MIVALDDEVVVDLFAGPGGWSEGLRMLSPDMHAAEVGIEWEPSACATRAAAGHRTIRADIATYRIPLAVRLWGLIASPPCPQFSAAGSGRGALIMEELRAAIADAFAGRDIAGHILAMAEVIYDDIVGNYPVVRALDAADAALASAAEAALSAAPVPWIVDHRPEWIALEQVPAVLPLWREYARQLEKLGYSVWCGVLNAADYGVPQTRQRAILIASRVRAVQPPEPTHAKDPQPSLFGELRPWVTMAEALGWPSGHRLDRRQTGAPILNADEVPTPTIVGQALAKDVWRLIPGGSGYRAVNRRRYVVDEPASTIAFGHDAAGWAWERPATTVCGDPRLGAPGHRDREGGEPQFGEGALKMTAEEALVLQSFRPDYPVQGTKGQRFGQIGNAVPPLLAAHVLSAATGVRFEWELAA